MFAQWLRWHLRTFATNPILRAGDRLQGLAVILLVLSAPLVIPLASHAGALVYEAGVRTAAEQGSHRHSVDAVALEGRTALPVDFDSSDYVRAQWHEGSTPHSAQVVAPATVKPGDTLKIWLDDTGEVVSAPLSVADAKLNAFIAAGLAWTGMVMCCALLAFVFRRALDGSRARAWDRELYLLTNNDDGWANRHI
ncbi:MAG: hypothetical protein HYZ38_08570 [Mycobacterium sp.]|nr:hypothetical protein [Mycobacterium sp.]